MNFIVVFGSRFVEEQEYVYATSRWRVSKTWKTSLPTWTKCSGSITSGVDIVVYYLHANVMSLGCRISSALSHGRVFLWTLLSRDAAVGKNNDTTNSQITRNICIIEVILYWPRLLLMEMRIFLGTKRNLRVIL